MTSRSYLKKLPLAKAWLPIIVVSTILSVIAGLLGTLGWVRDAEFGFDRFLNSTGNPAFDAISVFASELYSPKWAVVLTLVIMISIWLKTKSRLDAVLFGSIVASGWLPAEVFKLIFNEVRPDQNLLSHKLVPIEVDAAFPSGHLCFALAIGYGLFLLSRHTRVSKLVLALWILSIPVMGWARLYVGVHYINDLVGSLFATILGITAFSALWNLWLGEKVSRLRFFSK
jgi:undecaprenyl-diphosphatase